jgi:hypothetical protein
MDFNNATPYDLLTERWSAVLDHQDLPAIEDIHRRRTTAVLLENQVRALREQHGLLTEAPANAMNGGFAVSAAASPTNSALQGYDPILISLVRRAMPNVVAYDVAGVQPMTAPTGLIFAMRARYDGQNGLEAMYDEPIASFSGVSGSTAFGATATGGYSGGYTYTNPLGEGATSWQVSANRAGQFNYFRGFLTGRAENLGAGSYYGSDGVAGTFREMAFSIERVAVEARSRALKAEYTTELAQDLKAVHGLEAEAELANILSVEILNEINREIIRAVYASAKAGAQQKDLNSWITDNVGGNYDLVSDSDGRWSAERYRGLMYQIEREANVIAKETRRGKGNFILCSADVASALAMGGFLNLSPALNVQMNVDDTGNVFAGVLNGRFKVFIDPFVPAGTDFVCVGYKGASPYDAGMFYCPYVPLQMMRAVGENTFQPKIGFKTRYGMVANPFAGGRTANVGLGDGLNTYYRLFRVTSLHGNNA